MVSSGNNDHSVKTDVALRVVYRQTTSMSTFLPLTFNGGMFTLLTVSNKSRLGTRFPIHRSTQTCDISGVRRSGSAAAEDTAAPSTVHISSGAVLMWGAEVQS